MLIWSRTGRTRLHAGGHAVCPVLLPAAGGDPDVQPERTVERRAAERLHPQPFPPAFSGASWDALVSSPAIGFSASLFALLCGTGGVGAAPLSGARPAPAEYAVLHTQRGAFSVDRVRDAGGIQPGPLQMNGTFLIVPVAHFVLISAFTFGNVMAGLTRLSSDYENVAASPALRRCFACVTSPCR